ncbi:MAG: SIMPL domain-containing protein [Thermoleophilia bacterium]|nr:SIMPL domain-containing protein [Thermoleophilia bacterium]
MDRMRAHPRLLIPLALALVILLVPASAAAVERTVSVTAKATLQIPNDSATVGLSASAERRTRGAALQAVSKRLRGVIAAVQSIPGVGDGDVKTGRISVRKSFRGERPVYRASEGIGVTLHEPDRAGELIAAAIAAGASGVSGPRFFVGDTEAAYSSALVAAFDKAKAKAAVLAAQAGAVLGPALSISEGGQVEVVPDSTAKAPAADCGVSTQPVKRSSPRCTGTSPPTKPGTSTVTATVGVVFALQ